jgi:CBS domain containing-hemolysin-like protein
MTLTPCDNMQFRISQVESAHGRSFSMNSRLTVPATPSAIGKIALAIVASALAQCAYASFLPPEMMDTAATYLAWFVIVFVPIGGIVLFWLVHILPEKIAHKRHHPQRDAIQVLCLLSLVFGGLLWPIAWLWAYTKPAGYKIAYGTEKHEDYYHEMGEKAQAGELLHDELAHLRAELDAMDAKGTLTVELRRLRADLDAAQAATPAPTAAGAKAGSA